MTCCCWFGEKLLKEEGLPIHHAALLVEPFPTNCLLFVVAAAAEMTAEGYDYRSVRFEVGLNGVLDSVDSKEKAIGYCEYFDLRFLVKIVF
jgi:hypothetical protein